MPNIIQQQDALKNLPDMQLQQELVRPTGAVPSFLVLSELNRRKDLRQNAQSQQAPQGSIADEFTKGLGGQAQVGNYGDALRSSSMGAQIPPNQMMQSMPGGQQPQGYASGGGVDMSDMSDKPMTTNDVLGSRQKMVSGDLLNLFPNSLSSKVSDFNLDQLPLGIGSAIKGDSFGDVAKNAVLGPAYSLGRSIFGFADGGAVGDDNGLYPSLSRYKRMMTTKPYSVLDLVGDTSRRLASDPYAQSLGNPEIGANPPPMREPGYSLGETMARKLQGRSAMIPPNAASPGDEGVSAGMMAMPGGGQGYGGPEPMGLAAASGGQGYGGPDPMLSQGDQNVSASQGNPAGLGAVAQGAPNGGLGGGVGAGGGGPRQAPVGGEGLNDYMAQIRGLQMPDRFGEMEGRNKEDRDKLLRDKEGDKGMALLTAGLGIAGGASPFASVNIGQGGLQGVKYWADASKETRLAEQAIRQAENQITIARANRDEKQLDNGLRLYEKAQEAKQRSLDRANSAGIASADRQTRLDLMNKELESKDKDRLDAREQSRVSELGVAASRYTTAADAIDMKVATLSANPLAASDENAKGQLAALQAQANSLRSQADNYGQMHRQAIIDREVRNGRLAAPTDEAAYGKLKSGTRYVAPDGSLRVKP